MDSTADTSLTIALLVFGSFKLLEVDQVSKMILMMESRNLVHEGCIDPESSLSKVTCMVLRPKIYIWDQNKSQFVVCAVLINLHRHFESCPIFFIASDYKRCTCECQR